MVADVNGMRGYVYTGPVTLIPHVYGYTGFDSLYAVGGWVEVSLELFRSADGKLEFQPGLPGVGSDPILAKLPCLSVNCELPKAGLPAWPTSWV